MHAIALRGTMAVASLRQQATRARRCRPGPGGQVGEADRGSRLEASCFQMAHLSCTADLYIYNRKIKCQSGWLR